METSQATPLSPAGLDGGAAVLPRRRPWLVALGYALIPVAFTAAASALAQAVGADAATSATVIGIGASLAAAVGILLMRSARPTLRQFGFRAPAALKTVIWFIPLLVSVGIASATSGGVHATAWEIGAYALLSVAVGVNEEIWFRGLVTAVLRSISAKAAVVGSSALFGVLHLANLAGGQGGAASLLQVGFAIAFGFVAGELVIATGSLWPAIIWHASWDFVSFLGGNATNARSLIGTALASLVVVSYAIILWPRVTRFAK